MSKCELCQKKMKKNVYSYVNELNMLAPLSVRKKSLACLWNRLWNVPKLQDNPWRAITLSCFFGVGVSRTTFTWAGLTSIPLWVTINLRNFLALTPKAHLVGLSFMLYARIRQNASSRYWVCSAWVSLFTTMSSM